MFCNLYGFTLIDNMYVLSPGVKPVHRNLSPQGDKKKKENAKTNNYENI